MCVWVRRANVYVHTHKHIFTPHILLSKTKKMTRQNIVHRDLKPENIMYANMKPDSPVKVVDFGLSTTAAHGDATMKASALVVYGVWCMCACMVVYIMVMYIFILLYIYIYICIHIQYIYIYIYI